MKFHRLWGEGGREQDTSREASGDPRLQSSSSFPLNCPHVLCCTVTHYQLTYLDLFWTIPTWKDLLEMKRSSLARHIWRRSLRQLVPPIFFIILPPQPESWSNTCPFIIWPCNQCLVAGHCFGLLCTKISEGGMRHCMQSNVCPQPLSCNVCCGQEIASTCLREPYMYVLQVYSCLQWSGKKPPR